MGPGEPRWPVRDGTERDSDDPPGWIWDVLPRVSTLPRVAMGHSGNQAKARECVEAVLSANELTAGIGIVIGPRGETDICRRSAGGYWWGPMFPGSQ